MGKYTSVLHKLQDLPDDQPAERRERLNIIKGNLSTLTTVELCKKYKQQRARKNELEEKLSGVNENIDALQELIVDSMMDSGMSSIRLIEGGSVSHNPQPYAQVTDRDVYNAWIVNEGLDRLRTVPWQSTNSMCKERLLTGKDDPPGTKLWVKHGLTLRK
jgi:hypothetical protein